MPDREWKRVLDDRSDILKGSFPKSPPAHPSDMENPSIHLQIRPASVPLVDCMYLVFTRMPGGVTAGDLGLCCCVLCLLNAINSLSG